MCKRLSRRIRQDIISLRLGQTKNRIKLNALTSRACKFVWRFWAEYCFFSWLFRFLLRICVSSEFVCHWNYNKNVFICHIKQMSDFIKFKIHSFQQPHVFIYFPCFYAFCILIITCMISMIFVKWCVSNWNFQFNYIKKRSHESIALESHSGEICIFTIYFLFQVACRWKCKKNNLRHR